VVPRRKEYTVDELIALTDTDADLNRPTVKESRPLNQIITGSRPNLESDSQGPRSSAGSGISGNESTVVKRRDYEDIPAVSGDLSHHRGDRRRQHPDHRRRGVDRRADALTPLDRPPGRRRLFASNPGDFSEAEAVYCRLRRATHEASVFRCERGS
jgi:hypothetical protein